MTQPVARFGEQIENSIERELTKTLEEDALGGTNKNLQLVVILEESKMLETTQRMTLCHITCPSPQRSGSI